LAASRIDFPAWLKTLKARDRKIARFFSLGNHTQDATRKFDVSQNRISQLRKELAVACGNALCETSVHTSSILGTSMSHIVKVQTQLKDAAVVRAACHRPRPRSAGPCLSNGARETGALPGTPDADDPPGTQAHRGAGRLVGGCHPTRVRSARATVEAAASATAERLTVGRAH